jgi:Ca2+-binding EF-hand superfamily protein
LEELAHRLKGLGVPENTYSEVSWDSLQSGWNNVNGLIDTRRTQLVTEQSTQEANEGLRVDFATKAKAFSSFIKEQSSKIESLQGEIQAQIDSLHAISQDVSGGSSHYDELVHLTHLLDSAGVSDNPHTDLTIEGLKGQYDALNTLHQKKLQILEKELLAQSGSGLTPAQMQEFRECFKHFDKDEDNLLSRLELGACLKSLGEDINFDQGGKLDQILNAVDQDGDGKVTFEEFVSYMERVSSGSDTPDSIKLAFKTIAGDKDYITEADLRSVLPNEKVEYILARIKPYQGVPNAYDYNTFTDTLYA